MVFCKDDDTFPYGVVVHEQQRYNGEKIMECITSDECNVAKEYYSLLEFLNSFYHNNACLKHSFQNHLGTGILNYGIYVLESVAISCRVRYIPSTFVRH